MKTWIWIAIVAVVLGVAIYLLMNRPAVLLIRKAFAQLTGMELVEGREYHEMRAMNLLLQSRIDTLAAHEKTYIAEIAELQESLDKKSGVVSKLEGDLAAVQGEYDEILACLADMTTDEHVELFDSLTDGETTSHVMAGGVLTGEDRIKDANHKLTLNLRLTQENALYVQMYETQKEKLRDYDMMVDRLNTHNTNLRTQLLTTVEQRENCYAAHDDIIKSSERIRRLGITAGVVGVLVALIF